MSFRQITEYVSGISCANCWGIGKAFGDVPTPLRINITGSGFVGACAVCNGTFIALQDGVNPCRFKFDDGTRYGDIVFSVANTFFIMGESGVGDCYNRGEVPCVLTSTFAGETVSVAITDPPTPEFKIAIDQNFSPSLQTSFLHLGAVGADEVLILARKLDRIKMHVKFTPDY